ncbi:MAG: PD-(D/E)XK nuclease family protein [Acidimicrobiales bacterium]
MPVVTLASPGLPCLSALRHALAELREGDPLASAIVMVPGALARLHVRRALGRMGGVAAIDFVTAADLATRLAAPARIAAGSRPLPRGGWDEAVRLALAGDPGPFEAVAQHPAAVVKVAAALQRLRPATVAERVALAAASGPGRRGYHLLRLLEAVERSTAGRHDRGSAGPAACAALAGGADPGPVVAFCPQGADPVELDLLAGLASRGRLRVVAAVTGEIAADGPVRALVERLDGPAAWGSPPAAGFVPNHLVLAPDAEAEGRLIVQHVVTALEEDGVTGHDIAIVTFGGAAGISRVADLLDRAGVAWSGPAGHSLACTPSGRALLGLLGLDAEGWTHHGVLAALGSAPLRRGAGRPGPLPLGRWAALAREANVVGGQDQWRQRPAVLAERHRRSGRHATAAEVHDLTDFASGLTSLLTPPPERTWAALAGWALGVLDDLVSPDETWPDDAAAAHSAVRAATAGLAELDGVATTASDGPGPAELLAALETALAAPAPRRGRVGRGVLLTADPADLQGAMPRLVLLGSVVEGSAPARRGDDPLVPEEELGLVRAATSRGVRRAAERAAVLNAVAAAGRTVAFAHRADAQSSRRPSRWFLCWAGMLAGEDSALGADELEQASGPWLTVVPSFTAATCGAVAGSVQERRLAALAQVVRGADGSGLLRSPLVAGHPALARAVTAALARRSTSFTAWDGLLGTSLGLDEEVSASALEEWSTCPQRYLLHRVLGVAETSTPADALELDGMDRGSLAHEVLAAVVQRGLGRPPTQPWSEDDRDFLRAELRRRAEALRGRGRLGTGVLADLRIDVLEATLLGALDDDDASRADEGWVPSAVEESFGEAAGQPVAVKLGSGRVVRFHGRIDRVDTAEDGRVRVIDYKTGRAKKQLEAASGGAAAARLLQLAVYEAAAGARHPEAEVSSGWWLLEAVRKEGGPIMANHLGPVGFTAALEAISDGIEGGVFPADPGKETYRGFESCGLCPYDRVCRVDRVRALERVAGDPVLAPWRALRAVGEAVAEQDGGGGG